MSLLWGSSRPADDRQSISVSELQSAIAEAVRKYDPVCKEFVGVIIRRDTPKSKLDANWAIRGIKFGESERDKSTQAITTIVARMQREFNLRADS
jgi:hypothetical protein